MFKSVLDSGIECSGFKSWPRSVVQVGTGNLTSKFSVILVSLFQ